MTPNKRLAALQKEADTRRLDTAQSLLVSADFAHVATRNDGTEIACPVVQLEIPAGVRIGADIRAFLDAAAQVQTLNSRRRRRRMPNAWITLPEPPSANVYWRHYRGRMVRSAAANAYADAVMNVLLFRRVKRIAKPMLVSVEAHWYRSRKSGDLDNRLKALLDSCNKLAWDDDSQVVRILAERFDDPANPRIELLIQEVA